MQSDYNKLVGNIKQYLEKLNQDTANFSFKFQPNKISTEDLEVSYLGKPLAKINLSIAHSVWLKTKTDYWKYCFHTTDLKETSIIVVVELLRYILNQDV